MMQRLKDIAIGLWYVITVNRFPRLIGLPKYTGRHSFRPPRGMRIIEPWSAREPHSDYEWSDAIRAIAIRMAPVYATR